MYVPRKYRPSIIKSYFIDFKMFRLHKQIRIAFNRIELGFVDRNEW